MSSNIFQTVIDAQELSEGRPSQRHPLEGHDYHKKSDDQLHYIVKDAGEAAKSLKGTRSEGKYLDQVNDASTVLHYRKNDMPDWYKKKYGHMKESVDLDEESKHFEIYDTKTSKAVHSFKAKHMSHANIKADDWLESKGKTGKGLKVRPAKGSVAEEVELDEAISVEHDRYIRSHGKKASGSGDWMFTHKRAGDVDYKNDKEVHRARGSFSDAAKSAKAWAKSHGHSNVYVMEEVELDEKTLTTAELKKREEVAKAMEREKPGMPMSKKMAIATAVAKRVAEQNEDTE